MHYYLISTHLTAAFNVSLELQGGNCSDQLTLICRHSDIDTDPNWIHNGTVEAGQLLASAFPGLTRYSFQNSTEHRVTVTGVDNVTALDGYVFQCVYSIQGSLIKSNAVQYSFVPNGQSHTTRCLKYMHSSSCLAVNVTLYLCLQTTIQLSPQRVTDLTSPSASPPSPTPSKRAAASTRVAPHTSQ